MTRPTPTNFSIVDKATAVKNSASGFSLNSIQYAVDTGYVLFQPLVGIMVDTGCIEPIYWYHGDNESTSVMLWPDPTEIFSMDRTFPTTAVKLLTKSNSTVEQLKSHWAVYGVSIDNRSMIESEQNTATSTANLKYIVRDNQTLFASNSVASITCKAQVYFPLLAQVSSGEAAGGYYKLLTYTGTVQIDADPGDDLDFYVYSKSSRIKDPASGADFMSVIKPDTIGNSPLYLRIVNLTKGTEGTVTMTSDSTSHNGHQMFFGLNDLRCMSYFMNGVKYATSMFFSMVAVKTGSYVATTNSSLQELQQQATSLRTDVNSVTTDLEAEVATRTSADTAIVESLSQAVSSINTLTTAQSNLDTRVTALEEAETSGSEMDSIYLRG